MTPDDRKLLEALCVAMAGGLMADPDVDPRTVRWDGIADAASDALSAIRAAEGEEAQEPTQSVRTIGGGAGTASDLTAGNTIHVLAAKLDVALSERDQAEAIIHALVDERVQARRDFEALGRVFIRKSVRQDEQDDPKGAADEDPLTDVERMVVRAVEQGPCDDDELCRRLGLGHCGFMLTRRGAALWKAFCGLERAGVIERHFEESPPEPPPVNRMPVAPFEVPSEKVPKCGR